MPDFRKLILVVLCSGALSGLILFAIQQVTVVPLIEAAERHEKSEDHHHDAEWRPADGLERTAWTALTTILTAIGFAAILFGLLGLTGRAITVRAGVLWGLAAFACIHLAPSFGLPPLPPGVPVPAVQPRQIWWLSTVLATASGLWLIAGGAWSGRIGGVLCIMIPHLIGAPAAVEAPSSAPAGLIRSFTLASLATTAIFWPVLGAIGGYLFSRTDRSVRYQRTG